MPERNNKICEGDRLIRYHIKTGGRPKEDWSAFSVKKVNKDGTILLESNGPDKVPEEIRRTIAKKITEKIKPELKNQVEKMVEDSLTRLYKSDLEKINKQVNDGGKIELKSRPGCVYLKVGKIERHL